MLPLAIAAVLASTATSASLHSLCTVSNVQAALPANGTLLAIDLIPSLTTASVTMGNISYCNVTLTYVHTGTTNPVLVNYAFPDPATFQKRWYVAGGGGYSLNRRPAGGLAYGAVSGATSAGYDAFHVSLDQVNLLGNGSINWDAIYMFSYQALGEMTLLAKSVINPFYGLASDTRIYTYYEGCSDGGREGMSQIQRYGDQYDGVITGAPAFRMAQQQIHHVFSASVEKTLDYFPPPCELAQIVNSTIAACDSLDGRTDGVISRTDLCQLNFNLSSIVGTPYSCAAANSTSLGFDFSKRAEGSQVIVTPAQNGTVTAQGVAVAQTIYNGLHNSDGQRAYLSWQIGSELSDAVTTYDSATSKWDLDITGLGGSFATKFVQLVNLENLSNDDDIAYDTLVGWMKIAYVRYLDSLQTTVPDLSTFMNTGGKLIHYHGESDPSIPAASSIHYWQSVRATMYPQTPPATSLAALQQWYQLYLIPGAAHCGANALQPGPYPANNMATMMAWVEDGVQPSRLNATVTTGPNAGEVQALCQFPTRPLWAGNSSSFACVDDVASIDSWTYTFDAFKVPIY